MSTNSIVVATVPSESLAAMEATSRKAGITQLGGICLLMKYYGASAVIGCGGFLCVLAGYLVGEEEVEKDKKSGDLGSNYRNRIHLSLFWAHSQGCCLKLV
jgi:hypothetical protein